MDFTNLAEELEDVEALDTVAAPLAEVVDQVFPDGPTRDALRGKWLGHPLHPMLTDLPIGFWTTAFVFDLLPFRGTGKAARTAIGLGTLTALPTLAAGWADFAALPARQRRAAVVHGASNEIATALYAFSYLARRRGRTFKGVTLAMLGAGAATFGGYLGGQLVYRLGAGVSTGNHALPESGDGFSNGFGSRDDRRPVGLAEPITVVEAP
jgi:uncharacterized membrane protein